MVTRVAGLLLLSLLLCGIASRARAFETLTIDCSDTLGTAGDPIASGISNSWYDEVPSARIYPIKPAFARGITTIDLSPTMNQIWGRADSAGATVIVGVGGIYKSINSPDHDAADWLYFWDAADCDSFESKIQTWRRHVGDWIAYADAHKVVNGHTIPIQYDIWNEPDTNGGWHHNDCWGDSLFFAVWAAAVDTIRTKHPDAVICGPSLAGVDGKTDDNGNYETEVTMTAFIDSCIARDAMPDVLSWHDIWHSDPWDTDMTGEVDLERNLYAQIIHARSLVQARSASLQAIGVDPDEIRYEINEMLDRDVAQIPCYDVRNFALAQRAKHDGLNLDFVGRSCWCDDCQTPAACADPHPTNLQCSRLGGLIQPGGQLCNSQNKYLPRYGWWAYKAYADLSGNYVNAHSTAQLDAISSVDLDERKIRILAARNSANLEDVRLVIKNIDATLVINEAVHVLISRIHGDPASVNLAYPGLAPTFVDSANFPIAGDSTVIIIGQNDFVSGDVLDILVTPIVPDTTIAPGTFGDNEAAIQATEVGNTVIIVPQTGGAPWQEDKIRLKNGVRVVAQAGALPKIIGTEDTVIVFPENANDFTSFEGIEVQAGISGTKVLIALRGKGSIMGCTLKDMDVANVTGILVDHNANATVQATKIVGTNLNYGINCGCNPGSRYVYCDSY